MDSYLIIDVVIHCLAEASSTAGKCDSDENLRSYGPEPGFAMQHSVQSTHLSVCTTTLPSSTIHEDPFTAAERVKSMSNSRTDFT